MTDPMQLIFQPGALKASLFPPASRYHGVDTVMMETADGKSTVYLRRRFVPSPEAFALLQEHAVEEGDRLDNIAAHYLGDPELFWRLCDANNALLPDELVAAIGRRLRITMPEGFPGPRNV